MKNAKKNLLLLLSAAMMVGLSACDSGGASGSSTASSEAPTSSTVASSETPASSEAPASSETPASSDPASSEVSSSSDVSSSSTPVVETYRVRINAPTGVSITSDKEFAAKGETVTLTISVSSGFTLTALTMNGTALTVTNGTATFTMPDQDAVISGTTSIDAASGDVTVGGAVAAKMSKEGDLYVAHDVEMGEEGEIYVAVHGDNGFTPFGWSSYNQNKSFGVVSFTDTEMSEYDFGTTGVDLSVTGDDSLLTLGGNAKYDIYYDPADADNPIYIQRSEVIELPITADMLEDVFCNAGFSLASYHPAGVNGVTYSDSRRGNAYSWKLYENSSLATIENANAGTTYYVYNSYDATNAMLTVVDNYIEGGTYRSPLPYASTRTEYYDAESSDDNTAYSGHYKVQEGEVQYEDSEKRIKRSQADAEFAVSSYSHDVDHLDFQIHYGYRTGYTIEDDLIEANAGISSVENDDGTFTVTLDSYKIYNPGSSTYASMSENVYLEYKGTLTFTKAGAPVSGQYREWYYTSTSYDFAAKAKTGEGSLVKYINYAYTYGEANAGEATFDATPYFASSVTASIEGDNGTNKVLGGWRSDLDDEPLTIALSPATALDVDQFAVTNSSNTDIIAYSDSYNAYEAGSTPGSTTLTIGNIVTGTPSVDIDVEVVSTPHRSLYISGTDTHILTANSLWLYSNETWTTRLHNSGEDTNGGSLGDFSGMSVTSSNEAVCSATVDAGARTITFVSGTVEAATSVTLTVHSDHYEEGWPESTFTVTVYPQSAPTYTVSDFFGTYAVMGSDIGTRLTLSNETATYANETYYTGTLVIDDDLTSEGWGVVKGTVTFLWNYDASNFAFETARASVTWTQNGRSWSWTYVALDLPSDEYGDDLGLCLYGDASTWSGTDEVTTEYEVMYGQVTVEETDDGYTDTYVTGYASMEKVDA